MRLRFATLSIGWRCLSVSMLRFAGCVPLIVLLGAAPSPAMDPLRFFEGRTLAESSLKIVMKKPVATRTIGEGKIERDGSLTLIQTAFHDGKPEKQRHWRVRRAGADMFKASMNEAVGPVTIERVGNAYRFRYRMKGQLSVEQWVKPLAGGKSAQSSMKVKKLGLVVASSEGTIRKIG
jgi:hypothetical protein